MFDSLPRYKLAETFFSPHLNSFHWDSGTHLFQAQMKIKDYRLLTQIVKDDCIIIHFLLTGNSNKYVCITLKLNLFFWITKPLQNHFSHLIFVPSCSINFPVFKRQFGSCDVQLPKRFVTIYLCFYGSNISNQNKMIELI